jgi:hypothetical protein
VAKKSREYINYITPIGVAVWPHLHEPDVYQPEKGEAKIRYTINLSLEDDDMAKVKADIARLIEEKDLKVGKNSNSPFKTDKEGRETLFAFSGADKKPPVWDSKNRKVTGKVSGGSKVRLDLTVNPYDGFGGGVNFYLNGVQVVELQEQGDRQRSRFAEIDGGYEADDEQDTVGFPATDSVGAEDNPFV